MSHVTKLTVLIMLMLPCLSSANETVVVEFKSDQGGDLIVLSQAIDITAQSTLVPSLHPPEPRFGSRLVVMRVRSDGAEVLAEMDSPINFSDLQAGNRVIDVAVNDNGVALLVAYGKVIVSLIFIDDDFAYIDRVVDRREVESDDPSSTPIVRAEGDSTQPLIRELRIDGRTYTYQTLNHEGVESRGLSSIPILRVEEASTLPLASELRLDDQTYALDLGVLDELGRRISVATVRGELASDLNMQFDQTKISWLDYKRAYDGKIEASD